MSNSLILICDDETSVHDTIGEYLKLERMDYISSYDGLDALDKAKTIQPDLILMDVTMPKMFGTDVCREVRKYSEVPIIMLTAKSETIDKIIGLELGADDYITKPFSPREVVTRIKTVLRRSNSFSRMNNRIKYRDLEISIDTYEVYIRGKLVKFTPKEIKILYMLASNPGIILNRDEILSEVWGYGYLGDTRVVDTQIKRLRKKIPQDEVNWKIRSIYGVGYKFEIS
ncbi:response regulator transcription factor [Romboutsia lituseburensis]|uniref:response regulator transcription factor n=1 Tax=Romboutsia lituseburensis TaxID=1537 RepID=UPI00215AB1DA|nr:response regulator transcription factor [Romboutsia lituseburensis]MCR8743797.1 response regulator transcription factor [Romboutsia lituseburensis]